MKQICDSLLLINENGEIFRKRVPFIITLKDDHSNQTRLLVKRVIFEDDYMVLFEIENEVVHHSKCDIFYEDKVIYEKCINFVHLFL